MWDGLSTIIHIIVVSALSLVGVSVESAPVEEPRDELGEEAALVLDSPVVWRVDPSAVSSSSESLSGCPGEHDALRALVDRGVPVLLRRDDISS